MLAEYQISQNNKLDNYLIVGFSLSIMFLVGIAAVIFSLVSHNIPAPNSPSQNEQYKINIYA